MHYIGTKIVIAKAMTRLEYNTYRGWTLPADENGDDLGYMVEYTDGGASNHPNHKGYISWSPAAQFDIAYRAVDGLNFGLAVEAMRRGMAVARHGWNGIGMRVYIVPANAYPAQTPTAKAVFGEALVPYNAYFALLSPQKTVSTWAPSCNDALAEDWYIVT